MPLSKLSYFSKPLIIVLLWFFGNIVCIYTSLDFWPFSAFDMFTQYRNNSEVFFIKTSIYSNNNLIHEQSERHLPVIRYWQLNAGQTLSEAEKVRYGEAWLAYHLFLKARICETCDVTFIVSKIYPLTDNESSLLQVSLPKEYK